MNDALRKHLDKTLRMAVEAGATACCCERGCEDCGWTGVLAMNPNSNACLAEILVGCIVLMASFRSQGDPDSVFEVLAWARAYVAPNIPPLDREGVKAHTDAFKKKASEGRRLIQGALQGPEEPLPIEEMLRRVATDAQAPKSDPEG